MKFNFAKVTNSRLMGTLGLIISWNDNDDTVNQYFLLDAEGLGIADYVSLRNIDSEEFYREQERLMGGLGSDKIQISEEEALFLVNSFGNKNFYYEKPLPGDVNEYIHFIKDYEPKLTMKEMYTKICKHIKDEFEFINYMTMRFIAWDRESMRYFSLNEDIASMHITNINGTLLKNIVSKKDGNKFICEAIYEDSDGYYVCKLAFSIVKVEGEFRINSLLVGEKEKIYDFEVFDEIAKYEYLTIYDLYKGEEFIEKFHEQNPFASMSNMELGVLFTRYNFNNDHVKKDVYVINEDLKALYYVMDNKLYVSTYNKRDMEYINKTLLLKFKEYINLKDTLEFEQHVLYDFVESESDDFYDFIDIDDNE